MGVRFPLLAQIPRHRRTLWAFYDSPRISLDFVVSLEYLQKGVPMLPEYVHTVTFILKYGTVSTTIYCVIPVDEEAENYTARAAGDLFAQEYGFDPFDFCDDWEITKND